MKSVTFEAQGKEFALRMTTSAMCRYQERAGETILGAINAIQGDGTDMLRTRRLFWAALTERVTEEAACDLMDEIGLRRSVEMVSAALANCIEDLSGGEEPGNGRKPRTEKAT